ncbi:MAG TPA: dethiobiotin synthase [Caulobacteraceae bacterium]|jgi:dethiobiotin synthetase|nr:dethiobiotin synthase [Caulobacteraceae bacterium]
MDALFVAGTGTDIGKTYVTAALLRAVAASGRTAEALKPVVSGFDEAAPAGSDPAVLLQALGRPLTPESLDRISPWRYRAPLAPNQAARLEGRAVDAEAVIGFCRSRIADAEGGLVFIESAGGIMSPLDEATTMLDLAKTLAAPVLLVAGSYLGTLSHTLTAAAVIHAAGLQIAAVVVNESQGAPSLSDVVDEIRSRLPGVRVVTLERCGDGAEIVDAVLRA